MLTSVTWWAYTWGGLLRRSKIMVVPIFLTCEEKKTGGGKTWQINDKFLVRRGKCWTKTKSGPVSMRVMTNDVNRKNQAIIV